MKLLYCANDPVPFPKGAGVRIEATVRALQKAGAEVTLLTPKVGVPEGFPERLEGLDHRPVEVGPGESPFLERALRFRRAVEEVLASQPWSLFWFRSPWEGMAALRCQSAVPLLYEAHGFPSMELPHHFPALYEEPEFLGRLAWEEQQLLQRAQLVLTPSQTGRRFLSTRGVSAQKVRVVPNSAAQEAFLERHEGPGLQLIYTGTLAPWQGLEMLLEALLHLKGKLELELLLVGTRKGRWTRPLRSLAQQLRVRSLIRFEGPFQAPELRQYLSRAHIGVAPLPSDPRNTVQGCCPIKLVEFMAAGLPILSTRLPVVEELVEHQRSAWLVRPNSPYALAQGILKLADDPALRQSLGQAAQQRAREQLHRSHFETSLAQILAQLTGGG
jgi:glycosyltransferase involved in cell wall biosynthesis